jgi:DNA mismatch repair protein MutL
MPDIIQLLPDSIANQIAAGEVIQRPASAVKELLENALDAGARTIKLILKDAGKTLIQVIDDGSGMSETDARMSFERHATSKIRKAEDLFNLSTMGFRGEALASIAAIAQVEVKTRRADDEMGCRILVEGSEVKLQELCQTPVGTNFQMRNLFFNVPARRNFLKSNTVEMRHILDEFERIALANADVFFSLHHNGQEIFHLPSGNLRQRIVNIFGKDANKKLVPLQEETDVVILSGFVGKPEFAKKTRGEQFFFVNQRFIKSQYLNHAVLAAFEDLVGREAFPMYFIFIEIDPARIDVNVHPTKQEIKFEDERIIYNYLKVAIRHALGQNAVIPMLDFDQEANIMRQFIAPRSGSSTVQDAFQSGAGQGGSTDAYFKKTTDREQSNLQNWEKLYKGFEAKLNADGETEITISADDFLNGTLNRVQDGEDNNDLNAFYESETPLTVESLWQTADVPLATDAPENAQLGAQTDDNTWGLSQAEPYQMHATYIVCPIKSGFILIDQQAASERILFEKYLAMLETREMAVQTQLFPKKLEFSSADAAILVDILPEIIRLGFDIRAVENEETAFYVQGLPADLNFSPKQNAKSEQEILDDLLGRYKLELDLKTDISESLARAMARSSAIRRGTTLSTRTMRELIDQLFACEMPFKSPTGRNCFISFDLDDLQKQFLS